MATSGRLCGGGCSRDRLAVNARHQNPHDVGQAPCARSSTGGLAHSCTEGDWLASQRARHRKGHDFVRKAPRSLQSTERGGGRPRRADPERHKAARPRAIRARPELSGGRGSTRGSAPTWKDVGRVDPSAPLSRSPERGRKLHRLARAFVGPSRVGWVGGVALRSVMPQPEGEEISGSRTADFVRSVVSGSFM